MANEQKIINDVKKAVDGLSTSFKALDDVLEKNMANQKDLIKNLQAIKTNLAGTKSLKEFVTLQKRMNDEQLKLNKTQQAALDLARKSEQRKQQVIKTQQAAINAAKKEQLANEQLKRSKMQTAAAEERATKRKEKATRESREASRAYNIESKRLLALTKSAKDAAIQYGVNSKQARQLRNEQQKLDRQIKKVDASLGQHQRNVGNYGSAWGGVKNAIMGATGFIGGVALAGTAIRKIGQEMKKNAKIQNSLRQQYKLTNDELKEVAESVQVIANVYEKDYNEVIQSANALSKEFGISAEESLSIINEGFEKGADNSGEFLSMLREYPAQLRSVGLNADQSISIMTQAVREGVFSDKGVDAIKEAGIRLRELTPATRAALDNIGLASDEIEQSLRDGTKSMFEVIQEVSRELGKLPEQSTEVGTALADIFGGPGEDAGIRYIKMLGDVSMSLDDVKSNTDPYIESQRELTEEWTRTILQMQSGNGVMTKLNNTLATTLSIFNAQVESIEGKGFFGFIKAQLQNLATIAVGAFTGNMGSVAEVIRNLNKDLEIEAEVLEDINSQYSDVTSEITQTIARLRELRSVDAGGESSQEQIIMREMQMRNESFNQIRELADAEIQEAEKTATKLAEIDRSRFETFKEFQEKKKELVRENEEAQYELATTIGNALFERRIENYNQDLEANSAYYDNLLANQELSEEQRALLEAQRLEKENEIRRKQREAEKQQFLFSQAMKVGEIWMNAALAKAAITASIAPFAAPAAAGIPNAVAAVIAGNIQKGLVTTQAALQTGIILAQSIPQFDKGSKNTPETYVAGEKRPEIRIDKKGNAQIIDKPTLFQNDAGSKIIGGFQTGKLMDSISNYTNSQIVNNSDKITGNDELIGRLVSRMIEENSKGNKGIIKAIERNKPKQSRQTTIDRMRTDELKSKLRN